MRFTKNMKLRWRYFLSYALILLLPILVSSVIYNMAYRLVEQKELEVRTVLMHESMVEMDQTMERIDGILIDMMRSSTLTKLLLLSQQPQYGSPNAAIVHAAYQELSTYIAYANPDCDIALYMRRPNLVFDGQSIIYGQENYYNIGNSYQGMDYAQFEETVLDSFHSRNVVGDVIVEKKKRTRNEELYIREKGFLYLNTLPLVSGRQNNLGTAVVHVGAKIEEVLTLAPVAEYGCTYVTNEEQNLIAGIFGEQSPLELVPLDLSGEQGSFYQTIEDNSMLITYVKSSYNGWYYISMSPMNHIMGELRSFQLTIILITSGVAVFGILLSAYFSKRNAKPLEEILVEIQKQYGGKSSTPGDLNKSLKSIIIDNVALQKTLDRQKIQTRTSFYESLFHGEFRDDEEVLAKAHYLNLELEASAYCVVMLAFEAASDNEESYLQTDIAQIFTKKVILRQTQVRTFSHILSENRLGVLICFGQEDEKENRAITQSVVAQLIRDSESQIVKNRRCYVGNVYTELSNVCLSFGEASTVFDMQKLRPSDALDVYYRDVINEKRGYFYPPEIETKLKLLSASGAGERVQQVLDYVYEENFTKLSLNRQMAYALFANMYTTIINLAGEKGVDFTPRSFYKMRPNTLDCDAEFAQLRACYGKVADLVALREPIAAAPTMGPEEYVKKHFSDSGMSITHLAQHFYISETYFSQYFKKTTGQSFSKYLETLRINKACERLHATKNSIEEIAAQVGYTSDLSFRRAFKKVVGVSPSVYRQKGAGSF